MSRRLSMGLATTAMAAGLALSPALAGAANAETGAASSTTTSARPAACAPEACWDKGGTFRLKRNCQKDGRDAVRKSAKWTAYTCKQSLANWKYTLYLKPRY